MIKSSSWQKFQMPLAATIWIITAAALLWIPTDQVSMYVMIALILSAIFFFSVSDRLAFFLYILLTLVTVFAFLYQAFVDTWSPVQQAGGIGLHFLLLFHFFALYSLAKYIYSYRQENSALKNRVEELQEYISEQGVLTKREFEKQAYLILSSMARNKEPGYFVQIDVSSIRKVARKRALIACSSVAYGTLRKHYDLVGQLDDKTVVVLLQNIKEEGFTIVEQRIKEALQRQFEEDAYGRIIWHVHQVEGQRSIEELLVVS